MCYNFSGDYMLELLSENKNVWDAICESELPIVVYGMGNASQRIISLIENKGGKISDVFASDEFVRGHYFLGHKVLKYSEVCEKYDDFIVVLGFATRLDNVLNNIERISKEHIVLAPDIPVAGGGLFTYEYVKENEKDFDFVYSNLADEKSRKTFINVINFKISGKVEYLLNNYSDKDDIYKEILKLNEEEIIVDLGAYDGDTIREFTSFTNGKYKHIYALEPDEKNFRKLEKNTAEMDEITLYNMGAWSKRDTLIFAKKAGRNSKLSGEGVSVEVSDIDSLINKKITLLKMDIEGSELKALEGAEKTIKEYKPKLYICAYHRNEDLFTLGRKILSLGDYELYFRQSKYIPAWECNFYAVHK